VDGTAEQGEHHFHLKIHRFQVFTNDVGNRTGVSLVARMIFLEDTQAGTEMSNAGIRVNIHRVLQAFIPDEEEATQ
jgi:hypothetical protein